MHHPIKTLFFTALLFNAFANAATIDATPTMTNPNKTIMVDQKDQTFTITMASTPSTGFTWLLNAYNPNFLTLTKHQYVASSKNMPGASGVENWTFSVNPAIIAGPQVTKITMINARMWDVDNTTSKETTFTVVIN